MVVMLEQEDRRAQEADCVGRAGHRGDLAVEQPAEAESPRADALERASIRRRLRETPPAARRTRQRPRDGPPRAGRAPGSGSRPRAAGPIARPRAIPPTRA